MPRRQINLKTLPTWLQFLIAIVVAAPIMFVAWRIGQTSPGPIWIKDYAVPTVVGVGVVIFFFYLVRWLWGLRK